MTTSAPCINPKLVNLPFSFNRFPLLQTLWIRGPQCMCYSTSTCFHRIRAPSTLRNELCPGTVIRSLIILLRWLGKNGKKQLYSVTANNLAGTRTWNPTLPSNDNPHPIFAIQQANLNTTIKWIVPIALVNIKEIHVLSQRIFNTLPSLEIGKLMCLFLWSIDFYRFLWSKEHP